MSGFRTFVIMPFGSNHEYEGGANESEYVYKEIIYPAVRSVVGDDEFQPESIVCESNRHQPGSITASMIRDIVRADVVIADITGPNPNVFMELGIRFALRDKITIIIAQEGTIVPFDIKGYRCIEYHRFKPWEARERIVGYIRQGLHERVLTDSPVFDVFSSMSVIIPGIVETHGPGPSNLRDTMSWTEYISRIEWVAELLKIPVDNGRFRPHALIGLSNGGLIVADLLGRESFRGTPILGLWVDRFSGGKRAREFFKNPYNDALVMAIKSQNSRPITLMLVDDHLGTGVTASQATKYLYENLGEDTQVLYVPLVSRRPEYIGVVEEWLPYSYRDAEGNVFRVTRDEFLKRLDTKAIFFPYQHKSINVSG